VVRWDRAGAVPRWALDDSCRAGSLVRLLPGVFADASRSGDPDVRHRAALTYAGGEGGGGALSHTSALAIWGLIESKRDEVEHVTVVRTSTARSQGWLVVHHPRGFTPQPPHMVVRDGLPVTRLERSLVDAWPWLPPARRRAPLIAAVNDRLTTPERLAEALSGAPRITGHAELRELVDKLAAGCRSALEIWGHDHVFTGPGMPPFQRQVPVRLGATTVYLDVYDETTRVNFELDGATVHGNPRQREIDLRRDSALAARGILVVRFSHDRLINDTAAVRREVRTVLLDRVR